MMRSSQSGGRWGSLQTRGENSEIRVGELSRIRGRTGLAGFSVHLH